MKNSEPQSHDSADKGVAPKSGELPQGATPAGMPANTQELTPLHFLAIVSGALALRSLGRVFSEDTAAGYGWFHALCAVAYAVSVPGLWRRWTWLLYLWWVVCAVALVMGLKTMLFDGISDLRQAGTVVFGAYFGWAIYLELRQGWRKNTSSIHR